VYEKILVPLDGSKLGEAALPWIKSLISKFSTDVKIEVELLQVLSPIHPQVIAGYHMASLPLSEQEQKDVTKKAIDYLDSAGKVLVETNATVRSRVAFGNSSEEIVKIAEASGADLIAISTHGRSGFSRWAFGSVTDEVLKLGPKVPVLVIRPPQKHG
jgi:nucleotide-binding universal stress UspA family protein